MKKTLAGILALMIIVLAGCGGNVQTGQDDNGDYILASSEMNEKTAAAISEIKTAFEGALAAKSAKELMPYIDEAFGADEESLTAFFASATAEGKNPYTVYDDYYLPNLKVSDVSIRAKKSADATDYIRLTPGSEDVYAVMYVSENKTVSQMISIICAKMNGDWKIVWIDTSDFSYYGKTAQDLYRMMLDEKDAGNDMLSYIYAQMTYNIQQPGNLLCFKDSEIMTDAIMERNSWGKDKFPNEIIAGKKIHMAGIALEEQGVVPMVLYHTETDIKNVDAIRAEAAQVRDAFLAANPGIADAFEAITVRASNVDPSTATEQFDYESVVLPMK